LVPERKKERFKGSLRNSCKRPETGSKREKKLGAKSKKNDTSKECPLEGVWTTHHEEEEQEKYEKEGGGGSARACVYRV